MGFGVARHKLDHVHKGFAGGFEATGHGLRIGVARSGEFAFGLGHLRSQCFGGLPTVTGGLAAHQVVGLDGGRAFVNGQDLGVAVVLRCTGFFDEAHAAVHLHTKAGDFQAHLGAVALDQRHHEFVERQVLFAHLGIEVVVRGVIGRSGRGSHGAAAFGVGAHGHQHAAHIGVVNDRASSGQAAIDRTALHAVAGVLHGLLVRTLGNRDALHTYRIAGGVHHDEHVFEATVFLTH